jgi:hypothetical protein
MAAQASAASVYGGQPQTWARRSGPCGSRSVLASRAGPADRGGPGHPDGAGERGGRRSRAPQAPPPGARRVLRRPDGDRRAGARAGHAVGRDRPVPGPDAAGRTPRLPSPAQPSPGSIPIPNGRRARARPRHGRGRAPTGSAGHARRTEAARAGRRRPVRAHPPRRSTTSARPTTPTSPPSPRAATPARAQAPAATAAPAMSKLEDMEPEALLAAIERSGVSLDDLRNLVQAAESGAQE